MTAARRILFAGVLLIAGLAAGAVLTGGLRNLDEAAAQAPAAPPPVVAPAPVNTTATLTDFSRVAERTVPAVVNISAQQVVRRRVDPFFSLFYGQGGEVFRRGVENSLGSGVIVSADGYILTNNHVVIGEASRLPIEQLNVSVALADKRELPAKVIGTDPATDLALLKVDATKLPTMPWGDSSALKVAEWVLAIGNPYQLSQTVTLGIVSAVNRQNLGVSAYEDFIQTDAAINPGNSGGALVNARGELVGINTVIFSQSGGYQGIGFAVSSNLARRIFSDLERYGEVRRGTIDGVADWMPLTTRLAAELGAPDTRGAVAYRLYRDSPAYRAGLQPGDIVVSFNGQAVESPAQLTRLTSDARIGSTATLAIIREGRRLELKVPIDRPSRRQ
jgi:serine protease Do